MLWLLVLINPINRKQSVDRENSPKSTYSVCLDTQVGGCGVVCPQKILTSVSKSPQPRISPWTLITRISGYSSISSAIAVAAAAAGASPGPNDIAVSATHEIRCIIGI